MNKNKTILAPLNFRNEENEIQYLIKHCTSPFEFKETVFKRDFLKKIYDYRVVWENAQGYKIIFYVTDDMYNDDLLVKVNTEILATDSSVKAVIVQAIDYENIYTVDELSVSTLVSSIWFHVIQQDKTVWDVVAPVLQYFLNPRLKLPVFNTGIRYVLQSVDKFKPGCPVPWREADINIEYAFREAVKILNISDVVADYVLTVGKQNVSSFFNSHREFNKEYVEEIISKPESSELDSIYRSFPFLKYSEIKKFIYDKPYGDILPIIEKGGGSFPLKKFVFKQFISELHCFEKNVFERNSLAKLWRKTWKKVSSPKENLVWYSLLYTVENKKYCMEKRDSSLFSSQDFSFDLEKVQCYETNASWILVKDNIIAWTVPTRLNVEGKFASAEFVKEDGDVFGFVKDKKGNVYVFPQVESINYGYSGTEPLALIYSLTSLIENDLQSELKSYEDSSPLRYKIVEKVYYNPWEENLIVVLE